MVKIDEVKELIGFLKAIFIVLIVINTSLIAWIFKNYSIEVEWKLYVVLFLIFVICFSIAKLFLKILREIKSLKDI